MNAAGRLVHHRVLVRHFIVMHLFNKREMTGLILLFAILLSALSMVYVTHMTRILYADYQHQLIEEDHLHVQQGQLLLERSTWMLPARIERLAETHFNMTMPEAKKIVVIHE